MFSRLNLAWKFSLLHASLLLASAIAIGGTIHSYHMSLQAEHTVEDLRSHISWITKILESHGDQITVRELQDLLNGIDRSINIRVTAMAADGTVLADSRANAATMDNHLNRPEIQDALGSPEGVGHSQRFSATLASEFTYLAQVIPERSPENLRLLRVALVGHNHSGISQELFLYLIIASLGLLALGSVVGKLNARSITSPLDKMADAANKYVHGDLNTPIEFDEIASGPSKKFTESFNILSTELHAKISLVTDERNRLQAVLGALNEGVIAVDKETKVLLINQPAADIFGISTPIKRTPLWELCRNPEVNNIITSVLRSGEAVHNSIALYARENPNIELTFDVNASAFHDIYGRPIGAVMILHDISERRLLDTMRRDFVANVSHELKTPLAAIRGLVETMVDDPEMPEDMRQRFLTKVHDQSDRLTNIVMDLLTLSRADASHNEETSDTVNLHNIIRMSTQQLESHALSKNVTLIVQSDNERIMVLGDAELLRQAIDNLINNGIKYSSPGDTVTVTLEHTEDEAIIHIQDTGLGIPKQHIDRIWERFYRVDKARSRQVGGTGLGLSIVRNVITRHGGSVAVESEADVGSCFTIRLPRHQ